MSDANSLVFKIDFVNSIEVNDLILSLNGLSNQYTKFIEDEQNNPLQQELKLYIKEIKKGSLIADFFVATAASGVINFTENAITILEFIKYLKCAYDYFSGKSEKTKEYTKSELKNLRNIIEPVAKDNGSQMFIQNCDNVVINVNSQEANAIQNRIKREEEKQIIKDFRNVKFTLFKARVPQDLTTGFSGIIDEILPDKAITTVFQDIKTRDKIINIEENPLLKEFQVDTIVFFENEIPVKYQITNVL